MSNPTADAIERVARRQDASFLRDAGDICYRRLRFGRLLMHDLLWWLAGRIEKDAGVPSHPGDSLRG